MSAATMTHRELVDAYMGKVLCCMWDDREWLIRGVQGAPTAGEGDR